LYTISTSTGAATLVGPLVGASNASLTYAITGLAVQPGTGTLYGSTSRHSANSPGNLVTVNPATGQVTVIGPFGSSRTAADLTFTPAGTLYGSMVGQVRRPQLGTINVTTGAATLVGSTNLSTTGDGSGLASDSTGKLFYVGPGTGDVLQTVNPSTGVPTVIGTLTAGQHNGDMVDALDFSPTAVLFGVEANGGSSVFLITIAPPGSAAPPSTVPIPSSLLLALTGLACAGFSWN
jgi:hypothetical protein